MNARPVYVLAFVVIVALPVFVGFCASWRDTNAYDLSRILGLFVALIGSFGLFYRVVAGATAIQLIGMAMVVLAGSVVASPTWGPCIGMGVLGIAAALVAWRRPQS